MLSIWILAAGAAVTAAALVVRRGMRRNANARSPKTSIEPVSTEWLSHARGWRDENW